MNAAATGSSAIVRNKIPGENVRDCSRPRGARCRGGGVSRRRRRSGQGVAELRPSDRTALRGLPHRLSRTDPLRPALQDRRLYDGRRRLEGAADRRDVHAHLHPHAVGPGFAARARTAHQRQPRLATGLGFHRRPALRQSRFVHPDNGRSHRRRNCVCGRLRRPLRRHAQAVRQGHDLGHRRQQYADRGRPLEHDAFVWLAADLLDHRARVRAAVDPSSRTDTARSSAARARTCSGTTCCTPT